MQKVTTIQIDSDLVPALGAFVCLALDTIEAANGPLGPMLFMIDPKLAKSLMLVAAIASGSNTPKDFHTSDVNVLSERFSDTSKRLADFASNLLKVDLELNGPEISKRRSSTTGG